MLPKTYEFDTDVTVKLKITFTLIKNQYTGSVVQNWVDHKKTSKTRHINTVKSQTSILYQLMFEYSIKKLKRLNILLSKIYYFLKKFRTIRRLPCMVNGYWLNIKRINTTEQLLLVLIVNCSVVNTHQMKNKSTI